MRIRKVELSERGIYEPVKNEEDVILEITKMLEFNGALVFRAIERVPYCYRCHLRLGSSEAGTPDLSGFFPAGHDLPLFPFWFEVKRPKGGRKRPMQKVRIEWIAKNGGCAAFVRSWAEVTAEFLKFGVGMTIN